MVSGATTPLPWLERCGHQVVGTVVTARAHESHLDASVELQLRGGIIAVGTVALGFAACLQKSVMLFMVLYDFVCFFNELCCICVVARFNHYIFV